MKIFFLFFNLHLSLSENDFFSGEVTHLFEGYYNTIIPIPCKYFIKNSVFLHINDVGSASIDFRHRTSIELFILECMFFNCTSTDNGGAINYDCDRNGTIALSKICASYCYTSGKPSWCQFAYISISSDKNAYVDMLSYSKCSPYHQSYTIYSCFYIYLGNQNISYTNSSYNHANYYSSIFIQLPTILNLRFSSFCHNNVQHSNNLYFDSSSSVTLHYIEYCNILNNNSPNTGGGVIFSNGGFSFNDCIFMFNSHYLFYHSSTNKCYVNRGYIFHHSSSFLKYGTTTYIIFNSVTESNVYTPTYTIQYFSSYHCHGDFMNGLDLSPCITLPPNPTPAQTIPICQSIDSSSKQLLSSFVFLLFLFYYY